MDCVFGFALAKLQRYTNGLERDLFRKNHVHKVGKGQGRLKIGIGVHIGHELNVGRTPINAGKFDEDVAKKLLRLGAA